MARRRSRSTKSYRREANRRLSDFTDFSSPGLRLGWDPIIGSHPKFPVSVLNKRIRPPRAWSRTEFRSFVKTHSRKFQKPRILVVGGDSFKQRAIGVSDLRKAMICARREQRKEVLHALRKTGSGGGSKKLPRFTADSKVSCKRRK